MFAKSALFALGLLTALAGAPEARAHIGCAPEGADPAKAVQDLYTAVNRGDAAAVRRLYAPGFYAFDNGERMSGSELASQVDDIAKARPPYRWTVEDVASHVSCAMAWVTYTNRHVPLAGANVPPKAYLESVVLIWLDDGWKLQFFHSTPAEVQ